MNILRLAVLLWTLLPAANAAPEYWDGLTGQLLVANRHMADPHFARAVIYVIAHSDEGAMGLIVNRRAGTAPLRSVLGQLGFETRSKQDIALYYGGPVEPGRGFMLHSPDYEGPSTHSEDGIALSTAPDVLQAIAAGKGPRLSRLILGYAGWGRGQLDREVARTDWLIAPADAALILSAHPESIWERALKHAGMRL